MVYVGETIGNVLSGYDQLEIFSKPVLESSLAKKTASSTSKSTTRSTSTRIIKPEPTPTALRSSVRIVKDDNGRVIYTVNYDTDTITFPDGKTTPIIIDGNVNPSQNDYYDAGASATASPVTWQQIPYTRFNAFVEQNYYNNNTANITDFLNKLQPRLVLMEQTTGWSSEKFYGHKLNLYIDTAGCWGGYAMPGEAHVLLSNPLYQQSCRLPYYFNGQQYYGNTGELEDNWIYFSGGLHESMHSINPLPIYNRLWLTEGFSEYNMYNILTNYGDINQETGDTYLYQGKAGWNWQGYVNNDYKDTTGNDYEIQQSPGYDITAWMFTMLRDDYGLNWSRFYYLTNNNLETLDKSDGQTNWQISDDMAVIDLFGRTLSHTSFDNQTKPIFRYDGPNGPGWGVRQWVPITFYGDLRTTMTISNPNPQPGQQVNINATIYNDGQTNLNNVSVKIYYDKEETTRVILKNQTVNIPAGSNVNISVSMTSSTNSAYAIVVSADPANIKLEKDEANNAATANLIFGTLQSGCTWEKVNGHWIQVCSSATTLIK